MNLQLRLPPKTPARPTVLVRLDVFLQDKAGFMKYVQSCSIPLSGRLIAGHKKPEVCLGPCGLQAQVFPPTSQIKAEHHHGFLVSC